MSTLRSLRLLNSVENGTVNGNQLQTYLTDAGRLSEFSSLLSTRGQTRRMAGSTTTMAAITNSQLAIDVVFKSVTAETGYACRAVVASPIAMSSVALNALSLNTLGANAVAWGLFRKSVYYETNIRNIIAGFANLSTATYTTTNSLIENPTAMADVAASVYAMRAVVASPATTTIMAASATSMALVAGNTAAIDVVAKETAIMSIVANSSAAMTEIVSRPVATQTVAANKGAILAISKVVSAWGAYKAGPSFSSNLALIVANLISVEPNDFPTLDSIIADATALAKVALNTQAVETLASSGAALTALANSSNLSIMLGSSTAMAVLGPNTSAMSSFLGVSSAWSLLFSSSVSKGFIVASTALVNVIAANASLLTYLETLSVTAQPASVPDGVSGAFQAFDSIVPVPAKLLIIKAKEVGIAATFSNYEFKGTPQAGANAAAILSLTGTYFIAHVAGYTGLVWDFKAAGVTAATLPIIKYVNMT